MVHWIDENHYVVRRWNTMGTNCAIRCFAESTGATAFMCNGADVAYTVRCIPRRDCGLCNPQAPRPTLTAWQAVPRQVTRSEAEVEVPPRSREVRMGGAHAEARGVYDKQAPAHSHVCLCHAVWGLCYRADCGGEAATHLCPWHTHEDAPRLGMPDVLAAFGGWPETQ